MSAINQRDADQRAADEHGDVRRGDEQGDGMTFDGIEAALRGELSARAESLAAAPPPFAAVRRAVRRDRTRRLVGTASGLSLVAALVAALTLTLNGASGSTAQSAASGPSPLLTIPTRGNLAGDSAFLAAALQRLDSVDQRSVARSSTGAGSHKATNGYVLLYANDDGKHRVVIGGTYDGSVTTFVVLVGGHGAAAAALKADSSSGSQDPEYFTYLGSPVSSPADGTAIPFVVLGPTNMTNVDYVTGATIKTITTTFTDVRDPAAHAHVVNGTAAGEVIPPAAATVDQTVRAETYTVFRAEVGGHWIDANPLVRSFPVPAGRLPTGFDTTAIRNAIVTAGRSAGEAMNATSAGGDALPDNVAQVLTDLANFSGVPAGSITYQVDWTGRATAQWDAALLDMHAPGLPAMQVFVQGLAAGVPDSDSPGMMMTFVRPAVALTPGHIPHTAAEFGGKPEPEVFGYQIMNSW